MGRSLWTQHKSGGVQQKEEIARETDHVEIPIGKGTPFLGNVYGNECSSSDYAIDRMEMVKICSDMS